jgi:hypothetical protein
MHGIPAPGAAAARGRAKYRLRRPAACITTTAGPLIIASATPDTATTVAWVVQGPRKGLALLLPGLVRSGRGAVRALLQVATVSLHPTSQAVPP